VNTANALGISCRRLFLPARRGLAGLPLINDAPGTRNF